MENKIHVAHIRLAGLNGARRRFLRRAVAVMAVTMAWGFAGPAAFAAESQATVRIWDQFLSIKQFQQQVFKAFNKANPDIKVEYTCQLANAYQQVLEGSFLAGDPPDIFASTNATDLRDLLETGWVIPLDKLAPSKEELQVWKNSFPKEQQPFLENANMFFGMVYSWPLEGEIADRWLFWNTRLFSEAGLKGLGGERFVPETWDDTRLATRKITELGQGKVYGIVHGIKEQFWDNDIFYGMAVSAGWPLSGFDYRTARYDFHHPGLRGSIQLWLDMRKDGSICPGDMGMDDGDAEAKFSQGLAGVKFGGWWEPRIISNLNDSLEYDTTLPPIPKGGERKGYSEVEPLANSGQYLVSSRAKNWAAIWRVIRFMTSREYQEGLVKGGYGISVFPECNKPEYFPNPAFAKFVAIGTAGTRTTPKYLLSKTAQNVQSSLLFDPVAEARNVMQGMWTGQLGWDAWDDLERRANIAFDKALSDAQKAGLMVARKDFTFPDWDPAENYPPPQKK